MSPTELLRKNFYRGLYDLMDATGIHVPPTAVSGGQSQIIYSWPGPTHIAVNILVRDKEIRVDLTFKGENADEEFRVVKSEQDKIEEIIGTKLEWRPSTPESFDPPNERQIIWRLRGADPTETAEWPKQHAWLAARLVAFRLAFGPMIEALKR